MDICKATGKKIYTTQKKADHVIFRMWADHNNIKIGDLHSYICPHCKKWHVGHPPKKKVVK